MNFIAKNIGHANASNIELAINIYLGEANLWQTVVLDSADYSNFSLAPGQTRNIGDVLQGEEKCLTIDEMNYLAKI
jgi:hypothetical protein